MFVVGLAGIRGVGWRKTVRCMCEARCVICIYRVQIGVRTWTHGWCTRLSNNTQNKQMSTTRRRNLAPPPGARRPPVEEEEAEAPPEDQANGEWAFKCLKAKRYNDKQKRWEYRVAWKPTRLKSGDGFVIKVWGDTWEPTENVPQEAIDELLNIREEEYNGESTEQVDLYRCANCEIKLNSNDLRRKRDFMQDGKLCNVCREHYVRFGKLPESGKVKAREGKRVADDKGKKPLKTKANVDVEGSGERRKGLRGPPSPASSATTTEATRKRKADIQPQIATKRANNGRRASDSPPAPANEDHDESLASAIFDEPAPESQEKVSPSPQQPQNSAVPLPTTQTHDSLPAPAAGMGGSSRLDMNGSSRIDAIIQALRTSQNIPPAPLITAPQINPAATDPHPTFPLTPANPDFHVPTTTARPKPNDWRCKWDGCGVFCGSREALRKHFDEEHL
ncbi:uncharacterized protein EV422DRAFT_537008 [Fimicolochytrium jonesii]|uniref:uncharacterized protein n=1 Tax=Fimicolochytrium jonesii TaxID=1396493 RepID=UPI0022FE14FE|nr:uncharacterized protein EV422DRAFT_537008 [Fimicolochytrium jonesii]KAI8818839.1 hypothetical protein EV422DRAFT_537008 [Fimicolochytrium jonesii]